MVFGNLAEWVTAGATVALAVGGLLEGYRYIRFSKKRNTFDVVRGIVSDPTIIEARGALRAKAVTEDGGLYDYSLLKKEDRIHSSRILNEYETISLSVYEGMTDKSVIIEQCGSSVVFLVKTFILSEKTNKSKPASIYKREEAEEYFPNLLRLYGEIVKDYKTE